MDDDETTALITDSNNEDNKSTDVDSGRKREAYYASFLFSSLSFLQAAVFVDWNPIANSTLSAFSSWSVSTLAWQSNIATIACPLLQWPVWILMRNYKLSTVLLYAAIFPLGLATGIRILPLFFDAPETLFTRITFLSSFLVGTVGVVFYTSLTKFSNTYFIPSSSSFVTGVVCMAANVGSVFAAVSGPLMVDDPVDNPDDSDSLVLQIRNYLTMYSVLCCGLFLLSWIYFPGSHRCFEEYNIASHVLSILRNRDVMLLMLTHSFSCIPIFWSSTFLDVYLSKLHIDEISVGILISSSVAVSCIVTLFTTKLVDTKMVEVKTMLLILLAIQAWSTIFLSVALSQHWSAGKYFIFMAYLVSNAIALSVGPHILEYGTRLGLPASEDIVSGIFFQASCLTGAVFYLCFNARVYETNWEFYILIITPVLALFLLMYVHRL